MMSERLSELERGRRGFKWYLRRASAMFPTSACLDFDAPFILSYEGLDGKLKESGAPWRIVRLRIQAMLTAGSVDWGLIGVELRHRHDLRGVTLLLYDGYRGPSQPRIVWMR
jgi:hypothetical protein